MWLNTAKPYLDDINVRKGIAHATDFDGMIKNVLRNDYVRKPNGMGVGWEECIERGAAHPSPSSRGRYLSVWARVWR